MKILFLDFDGVISTNRAWIAQKHVEDFYLRWIDPLAIGMLYEICKDYGYSIVVTSTWRNFGKDNCVLALGKLAEFLHDEWCTGDVWKFGVESKKTRPQEIDEWLSHNRVDDWLIVDDDSFDWSADQTLHWIKTDTTNGFSTEDYEEIVNRNEK